MKWIIREAVEAVTVETWRNCVNHCWKEEERDKIPEIDVDCSLSNIDPNYVSSSDEELW